MIIGISGRMGSGKNTVGDIIEKICLTNEGPLFEQKAFAGKLKQTASLLTGIPVEKFEDQEFKKTLLGSEWGTVKDIPLNAITPFADMEFNVMMSVREFLQRLGTEAMRDGLHTNVWVNALFADYIPYSVTGSNYEENESKWIITDMRFPNEMEAVELREGITIRVVRQDMHSLEAMIPAHASETALDGAEFDYVIDNNGTLDELVEKVREILTKEKMI